jgi:hypothetical protein
MLRIYVRNSKYYECFFACLSARLGFTPFANEEFLFVGILLSDLAGLQCLSLLYLLAPCQIFANTSLITEIGVQLYFVKCVN